ncbi:N-acetylmuramidase family protein [Galbibacter sp. BG1]|uniref:N-acetylmuramidase family protein n=1 Tax=Galbibacter sp. BG1 TaxID=1170699 RepID=UPI0015B981C2|nr:N-acetylmuramidase family protein [Galbibacter sp. BG1]QLE02872.1 N-acetylmuramidase family protein [Galbibacter sp. BG1]
MKPTLTENDFIWAADKLGCELAVIKAVAHVESRKTGFLSDGSPKILFEGHIFHRLTDGKYSKREIYKDISYPYWTRKYYGDGFDEYKRFKRAFELDPVAAIKSASWGKFQIMGFNYNRAGFSTPEYFMYAMDTSERKHLEAFVDFIKSTGLSDELQRKDWQGFARGYNGPGYAKNRYDEKLKKAYKIYSQ